MWTPRLAVLGLALLNAPLSYASDYDFRTRFQIQGAQNVEEGYAEQMELQIRPEAHLYIDDTTEATLITRLRVDAKDRLEVGAPLQDEASKYSKRATFGNHGDAELRELFVKKRIDQDYISVGKQQVVWGTADGLRVLDVVNPFSYREALLDDFDESRIPVWMINYLHNLGDNTDLQFLYIPDLTFNDFPDGDGDTPPEFVITSPHFQPSIPNNVMGVRFLGTKRPEGSYRHADTGLRLSTQLSNIDVTLNYLYQYDKNPVIYRNRSIINGVPVLDIWQQYDRIHLFGSTLSTDISSTLVLRAEIGYVSGRRVLRDDVEQGNGLLETDELSHVLGLDWTGISDTMLSMQWFRSGLIDDAPDLVRDQVDNTLSFSINSRFLNDTLTLDWITLHNMNDGDNVYRPKVTYALYDGVNIWLGADVFAGKSSGLFGQFDERDRVYAGIEWYL